MNRWEIQQNTIVVGCEEIRNPVAVSGRVSQSDPKGPVFCPKPRRVGFLGGNLMSLRWQKSQQAEINDAKAGAELLDLIFMRKEGHSEDQSCREIASSPPFFCGTPPSRVSNPLVHDAQFGDDNLSPLSTLQLASPSTSPLPSMSPSSMKSGGVRMKFGLKSPTVRVEGFDFDCLSRDHQNSRVTAMA
ncbi:hypothetical protein RND81_10G123100 [Saponaria officinalis]|uniref:Uncharacterized protein n=1 Tax=Saponaria officinalis TaxID=3572 RepID=A0AAW1I1X6_SAPOF